jgi:hypothetical protein
MDTLVLRPLLSHEAALDERSDVEREKGPARAILRTPFCSSLP